jgi:hypothetical protein
MYSTRMLPSDGIGAPRRCAIHTASGSVAAAIIEAASIRPGVTGRIIAATRITTVFHDRPRSSGDAPRCVQVLNNATIAALRTKYTRPALDFRCNVSGA